VRRNSITVQVLAQEPVALLVGRVRTRAEHCGADRQGEVVPGRDQLAVLHATRRGDLTQLGFRPRGMADLHLLEPTR